MVYKFLYVDDTRNQLEQGMINALQINGDIEITFKGPKDWEDLITFLKKEVPRHHGVILDLRLDDFQFEPGKSASYKGSTVAQELRNLSKEGKLSDFPIILFSGTDKIDQYLDPTSRDLFDEIVDKTKIEQPDYLNYAQFRCVLKWLADGYLKLKSIDNLEIKSVLDIADHRILDSRFVDYLISLKGKPIHTFVQFFIKEVLVKPSFLIDEELLAVRLGVDRSSPDWSVLKEQLKPCKYTGCFSSNVEYWWMPKISMFWEEYVSRELVLRNTSTVKRVNAIKEYTGLQNLMHLEKSSRSKSDSLWTVCKATRAPIDTVDGFVISGQDNKFPWQEVEYISIGEALRPTKSYKISSLEKGRLGNLKSILEKNERRIRK